MNWENSISRETVRVKELYGNVTELLESFGSMSVDSINSTLQKLKENVTYAEEIFSSGGKEDLQKKQQQINRVRQGKVAILFSIFNEDFFLSIRCYFLNSYLSVILYTILDLVVVRTTWQLLNDERVSFCFLYQ